MTSRKRRDDGAAIMTRGHFSKERWDALTGELRFRTSRSGGPGGQHVNKVETRVELRFSLPRSLALTDDEKRILQERLSSLLTSGGELRVVARDSRSQWQNRQRAVERFRDILEDALRPRRLRRKSRPSVAANLRRLEAKKRRGEIKRTRHSMGE
jgi:ribosome-associated protein